MRRLLPLLLALAIACSAGPTAPAVGDSSLSCVDEFCVSYPDGWTPMPANGFISFQNDEVPEAVANAAGFDPRGVLNAVGGAWPASTEAVAEAFWQLLSEGSGASLDDLAVLDDGSVRTKGSFDGGVLWHRMIVAPDGSGIGIEMRAPNASWQSHADVFLEGLQP